MKWFSRSPPETSGPRGALDLVLASLPHAGALAAPISAREADLGQGGWLAAQLFPPRPGSPGCCRPGTEGVGL